MKKVLSSLMAVLLVLSIIPAATVNSFAASTCRKGHTYNQHYCQTCDEFETDYTGMAKKGSTWYYVSGGEIDTSFTGLAKNDYGWWYMKNGQIDKTYTGMAKNQYGWWYVKNGTIDFKYTGMAKNQYGWFYMKKGKLDTTYTGLAKNDYGWWYMKNGKLDKSYTGMAQNQYGWWYVKNGKLDKSYTGISKNQYGYWYMKNGKLDKSYNGSYTDPSGGKWSVSNGKATFKAKSNYEVPTVDVKTRIGKVVRAWKTTQNNVKVEIHRVAYGSKITQNFKKSKGDGAIDYDKTVTYQPYCNIALVTASPDKLHMARATTLTGNSMDYVENMSKSAGAVIAVNGVATKNYDDMPVIYDGKLVNKGSSSGLRLMIYGNGTWKQDVLNSSNAQSFISAGVRQSVRFQDQPLTNGNVTTYLDEGGYYHNRTFIGQIDKNHYVVVVSEFMPIKRVAEVMKAYGVKDAYLLNGGNCSFMYVKGIGNTTGTKATQLKNLNKVNLVESEFFANNGMLGLNSSGKQKLGGPCKEPDIFYFK